MCEVERQHHHDVIQRAAVTESQDQQTLALELSEDVWSLCSLLLSHTKASSGVQSQTPCPSPQLRKCGAAAFLKHSGQRLPPVLRDEILERM